jgi:hypothetical protein
MSKRTTIRATESHPSERRRESVAFSIVRAGGPPRLPESVIASPAYPILLIKVNIGRYIAMTIPPMITPSMKIITGSISLTSP